AAVLHCLRREPQLAEQRSAAAIALATEHGFDFWLAHAKISHGWALVHLGQQEQGLGELRDGLTRYRATGAELECSLWTALLADAHAHAGQPDHGRAAVDESLAVVTSTGVRFHEPELYRLKGELLLGEGTASAAEHAFDCLLHAVDLARGRQAKSVELRAA